MTPDRIAELAAERRYLNAERQKIIRRLAELDEILSAFAPREREMRA